MLIRCARCQAVYTLADGLAPPDRGFAVECGRCSLVFDVAGQHEGFEIDPRRASSVATATPVRARRSGRRLRIALFGASAALALAALAISRLFDRPRPAGAPRAQMKLLFDDFASLGDAAALFAKAPRASPSDASPDANRAYALLLAALAHKDLARRLDGPIADVDAQVSRLSLERTTGSEERLQGLIDQGAQFVSERETHRREEARLRKEGALAARAAFEREPSAAPALRAVALALAMAGKDGRLYAERAVKEAPDDALSAYALAAVLLLTGPGAERQEEALSALAQARRLEPRFLRAQVDMAALALERGEVDWARETLTRVLEANSRHERARALFAQLSQR